MLPRLLLSLAVVAAILGIIVTRQPDSFSVSRSAVISAPPAQVFDHVNNLHKWQAWSPWARLDPNAKTTFSGPTEGIGATMAWDGNSNIGKGRMTITDSRPDSVWFRLDFEKPLPGTSTADFAFQPQANGKKTLVTWHMQGNNNFLGKAISLIFNCEKMIGEQFDKGLANLKQVVEAK